MWHSASRNIFVQRMLQLIEQVHIFQFEVHIFWRGASGAEQMQRNCKGVNNETLLLKLFMPNYLHNFFYFINSLLILKLLYRVAVTLALVLKFNRYLPTRRDREQQQATKPVICCFVLFITFLFVSYSFQFFPVTYFSIKKNKDWC